MIRDLSKTIFTWIVFLIVVFYLKCGFLTIYLVGCVVNIFVISIEIFNEDKQQFVEELKNRPKKYIILGLILYILTSWLTLITDFISYFRNDDRDLDK